ncbi:MAG: 4Fe-4S dicluster domain-containing protein [Coriobacteriales bacterium]|nr:4Fe-4S dicluster domain-containing protein [Coriobacteriales bacterium]
MAHMAIVTDLNRCVGCLSCNVACKALNNVIPGKYWNKTVRVGPNPKEEGGQFPDVEMYFVTVQCQHCTNPQCVAVCPTGASAVADDGTIQIDHELCIGCGACLTACPYGIRYLDDDLLAQKCNLCKDVIDEGGLPQCVSQCGGMARFFGDLDKGIETFEGAELADGKRVVLGEFCAPFTEEDVHTLPDFGNNPNMRYILRDMKWRTAESEMGTEYLTTFTDWRDTIK